MIISHDPPNGGCRSDRKPQTADDMKVFNLCLINKMGLANWAESKARDVRDTYFTKPWKLT
ncbi:hypothetical protein D3OALGA1CA_1925 [Olavius algarvensis associated proteobacterium Delta 3]|nr:hypothetical protein D3OALGA1CA_1925 [Olavius algarvensis associated proteobacterium Delta 3]CAB5118422.1 hypothetical protein D3OALGB2SA_2818 [Olavius algarvensis associated proteobacterium Delta 3]